MLVDAAFGENVGSLRLSWIREEVDGTRSVGDL